MDRLRYAFRLLRAAHGDERGQAIPLLIGAMGVQMVGPTLMRWGREDQKRRFLPRILRADDIWCQGYSEPGAGSDLASLQTRALRVGDEFVVNGHKVWTNRERGSNEPHTPDEGLTYTGNPTDETAVRAWVATLFAG